VEDTAAFGRGGRQLQKSGLGGGRSRRGGGSGSGSGGGGRGGGEGSSGGGGGDNDSECVAGDANRAASGGGASSADDWMDLTRSGRDMLGFGGGEHSEERMMGSPSAGVRTRGAIAGGVGSPGGAVHVESS
jgi:hypothetical protein